MAKATTTQVNTWDAALAKSAVVASKAEAKAAPRSFVGMGGGKMTINGADQPNNEAVVIALDQIHANLYYESDYDASTPVPPTCYAFGVINDDGDVVGHDTWDGRAEMAPHKDVKERVHTDCATCPLNQFGSAKKGKGKACQNTRRVALIPAGTMIDGRPSFCDKAEQIESAPLVYLKVPTMSVKPLSGWVTQVANALELPTWGVFGKLTRVPNAVSQYTAQWETLGKIPSKLLEAVYKRVQQAKEDIVHPFAPAAEVPAKAKGAPAAKKRKYT